MDTDSRSLSAAERLRAWADRGHALHETGVDLYPADVLEALAKIEDARSVCETLPGKLAQGNVEGALTEIQWLATRLADT